MSLEALSQYTFYSRYSQFSHELGRKENWRESVSRLFSMHRTKFAEKLAANPELVGELDFAEEMQLKKAVLGSQRSLQFASEPILKHELRMFNCLTTHIDRPRVFQETMYSLLCGCGVGFSVQKVHVKRLGKIFRRDGEEKTFLVPDSIEGWSDAVGVLVASYMSSKTEFADWFGKKVVFDFSQIRPKGALIAGRFLAPGPSGLKASLEKIQSIFENRISSDSFESGEFAFKLRPIDAYDIVMHISDSVLSGGVRRSATLSLFSKDDEEMIRAKTGDWFVTNPQRGRSNNSVALLKNEVTKDEFLKILESTKEFGEPGFVFVNSEDEIYNPCCISSESVISTSEGPRKVVDLIGKPFKAVVDGKEYSSTEVGFFNSGEKEVFEIVTKCGLKLKATADHRILTSKGWKTMEELEIGSFLVTENSLSELVSKSYVGKEQVYDCTIPEIGRFVANGIVVHNCEIGMIPKLNPNEESGFQSCNLTEINGRSCSTEEKFYQACRASAIIGTFQAGYTNIKYLTENSRKIFEREALLGCSITGIMDNPSVLLNPEVQKKGAQIILEVNAKISAMLGINPAARATCVKPAGSSSCVLSTSSGIHPHHAKRYVRRVQANKTESSYRVFAEQNPLAVEDSFWNPNGTDAVISFLCEVPSGAIVKNQIDAVDFLEKVLLTQKNWVEFGTRPELCVDPRLRHNVSNTITVKSDEWGKVADFIFENRSDFAGISLLGASGDLDYVQAPFSTVLSASEIVKEYGDGSVFASGLIVDGLAAFSDNLWSACDYALGTFKLKEVANPELVAKPNYEDYKHKQNGDLQFAKDVMAYAKYLEQFHLYQAFSRKANWIRRTVQFANRYFGGNLRKATYCLKHVSLWKTWCDLKREYKEIDWTKVGNDLENVDELGAQACAGGQCEAKL